MQIPPSGFHPQPARTSSNTAAQAAGKSSTGTPAGAAGTTAESGTFTLTTDLAGLLSRVRSTPEVRADAVSAAAAKLAAGDLTTPHAAGETAAAFLDGGN